MAASACATTPVAPLARIEGGRYAMGTALEVELFARDAAVGRARLEEAFAQIAALDSLLSHYQPESQISRLSSSSGHGARRVDARVAEVLRLAQRYNRMTQGAFDVTVGPLVRAWSQASGDDDQLSYEQMAKMRALVGSAELLRVTADSVVELEREGMLLDLGGIAKGYALDRVLPLLGGDGIEAALISFGQSSVWAIGAPPGEPGWRLLMRGPDGSFSGRVTVRDTAFSVSSSFGAQQRGPRYGQLIDPRTGWPVTQGLLAAVVAPTAAMAEAISTALLVLPADQGMQFVEDLPEVEARLIDDLERVAETSGWRARTNYEALPRPGDG